MKKFVAVFAALMVASSFAIADQSGSASATVYATVNPNVAVGVLTPIVDAGTVQMGDFSATIAFRIDANMEFIALYASASPLYKGDDPTDPEVPPIPLNLSEGVVIAPTDGNPINGGTNVAAFTGPGDTIGDYPTEQTETIVFESSQNNHFSQDVYCTVTWNQGDPEKPMGQYSGKVKITCVLLP